jgi:hypothetical protein
VGREYVHCSHCARARTHTRRRPTGMSGATGGIGGQATRRDAPHRGVSAGGLTHPIPHTWHTTQTYLWLAVLVELYDGALGRDGTGQHQTIVKCAHPLRTTSLRVMAPCSPSMNSGDVGSLHTPAVGPRVSCAGYARFAAG